MGTVSPVATQDLSDELGLGDHEAPLLAHWFDALDSALDAGATSDERWALLIAGFWSDHLGLDQTKRGVLAAHVAERVLHHVRPQSAGPDLDVLGSSIDVATAAAVFDACIDVLADCADVDETVEGQTALEVAAQELMRLRDRTMG